MKKLKGALVSVLDKLDDGVSWLVGAALPVKLQEFCAEKRVSICGIGVAAAATGFLFAGPFIALGIIGVSFCVNMGAAYCEDNVRKREIRADGQSFPSEGPARAVERAGQKMKSLSRDFSPARQNSAPETRAGVSSQPGKPTQKISP
ncbi:MAG: hypothetical protein Q8K65_00750 [Alphaproteobacteria bacterium]|nr:hypothetical protein [Alphaproteobacteria bacterium]